MKEIMGSKSVKIATGAIVIALLYIVLKEFQTILIPFIIAVIIAMLFEPLYNYLRVKKVPTAIVIIIILLLILAIANITSLFVYTSISAFQEAIPKYQTQFSIFFSKFNSYLDSSEFYQKHIKSAINTSDIINPAKLGGIVESLIGGVAGIFGDFVLILIYVIFLFPEMGSLKQRINSVYSDEQYKKISEIIKAIFKDVKKYLIGKTIINLIHASIVFLILTIFGVDFPILWAFLTFFMAYIPNIGSFIATILPVSLALIQFQSLLLPMIILILLVVVGNLIGNVAEPKVFGSSLNLSPLLLLFSLIFWGYVWGIVGMILSVPIMSVIKITLSKIDATKPIAMMMSNEITTDMENEFTISKSKILSKFKNLTHSK